MRTWTTHPKARVIGDEHPTQKPVEVFARPMRHHTKRGGVCYEEPFSGSGLQIIAAEQQGPALFSSWRPSVDVAARRWEEFTGTKAERRLPSCAG